MIDLHCHILNGVDDGPESIEISRKMIDLAYEDGIRQIIATPHINHPLFRTDDQQIKDAFECLKKELKVKYPDLKLFLGAEIFITSDYHEDLEKIKSNHSLNFSDYVLIEFSRDIDILCVKEIIHELKLLKKKPIIAHIEMYSKFTNEVEEVRSLVKEGAFIQVTGASVVGKYGNELKSFVFKLIKEGLVHFVASDGHGDKVRRPRLKKAYDCIKGECSSDCANLLFFENQQKVIDNLPIESSRINVKKSKMVFKMHYSYMVISLMAILFIGIMMIHNRETSSVYSQNLISETAKESIALKEADQMAVGDVSILSHSSEQSSLQKKDTPDVKDEDALENAQLKDEKTTQEYIIDFYYRKLYEMKTQYLNDIQAIVEEIESVHTETEDVALRDALIDSFVYELMEMEELSDIRVYALLYDMQNELERYRYKVDSVHEFREAYHETKADYKVYYLEKVRNLNR